MPVAIVPSKPSLDISEEEGKTLGQLTPQRRKMYNRIRRQLEDQTDKKLTEQEYHHLTVTALILDQADAYIEKQGGPQMVDQEFLNQVRLMRDNLMSRLESAREQKETVGSILKEAQEAMLKIKDKMGTEVTLLKTEDPESLIALMEKDLETRTIETKKADRKQEEAKNVLIVESTGDD